MVSFSHCLSLHRICSILYDGNPCFRSGWNIFFVNRSLCFKFVHQESIFLNQIIQCTQEYMCQVIDLFSGYIV